jgi:protein O-mannosyl-transferase
MVKKTEKPINPAMAYLKQIFNFSLLSRYVILAITCFVIYANSIFNKYAIDDQLLILKNTYVQSGISGIPKILTSDAFASFYSYMGGDPSKQLSGGRYRPLSEIVFALEQQLFGGSAILPYFSHLVNVCAYMACILSMFYFLGNFLLKNTPWGSDIAFLSTLLFAIHPIHTEVVDNIKSLDEILSLLFIMLTFIYSLKYFQSKKARHLIIGTSSFLFALLSKEYAVTLLFFIPLLFYLLQDKKFSRIFVATLPYCAIFTLYMGLRYNAIGFPRNIPVVDLLKNPYFYATHAQKIATEWFVLGKYLGLLIFPYPLSCDYNYNQIPYHSFSDITVLFSILIYAVAFAWGVVLAWKKNIISFAIFFYLINVFMISNFILDIGATMGERLVFHSSLGFVIILSYFLLKALSKTPLQAKKNIVAGLVSIIGILSFGETVTRNAQWKDDATLFMHDVNVAPNSFLVNNNAGWGYLGFAKRNENTPEQTKAYLDSAHKYLLLGLHFNKDYTLLYHNLGVYYLRVGLLDSVKYCYDMLGKLNPYYPGLKSFYYELSQHYFTKGLHLAMKNKNPREGIINIKKALLLDSVNAGIWYNLGIAYYQIQNYDSAKYAFTKTLQNKPDSMDESNAKKDLKDLSHMK